MTSNKIFIPYAVKPQINISTMYSFFRTHYHKDFEFSGETHNFWEVIYVWKGDVHVSADERVYHMKQGELIFHKPLELHKFYVDNASGATLLTFSFSLEGTLADWFQDKVFYLTSSQQELLRSLMVYAEEKLHALALINPEINLKDTHELTYYLQPFDLVPHYSQQVCSYFHQLFASLMEKGTISAESSAPDALIFREVVRYMNTNLSSQLSISQIARHCNISAATLKRLFDRYAGISVHKYFLTLKINTSLKLLKNGLSVTETAEQLGFSSQSYFSKVFKNFIGVPPTEYGQSE